MQQQRRSRPHKQCGDTRSGLEHENDAGWEQREQRDGRSAVSEELHDDVRKLLRRGLGPCESVERASPWHLAHRRLVGS